MSIEWLRVALWWLVPDVLWYGLAVVGLVGLFRLLVALRDLAVVLDGVRVSQLRKGNE